VKIIKRARRELFAGAARLVDRMGRPAAVVPMARPDAMQTASYTPEELARYEALVQRYARHVYNVAYRMTGNEADARDLSQEAFMRVYRALRRVEPGAPLESWLYRIVSNLYIDLLRKRPRHRIESLDVPLETPRGELARELPDVAANPEAIFEREQIDGTIQRALSALSEELRMVAVLSDVEGLSYEEIATVLHVPLGTVKSRLHRARQILQERLRPYLEARRRGWEP
jgi:RNA polymerase sigma-70 factor (ECF subfamily)